MFGDFLNHTCNIYHTDEVELSFGYGIKAQTVTMPGLEADEAGIPCHFHIRNNNTVRITQKEPYSSVEGEVKLTVPYGTDLRKNDIVEDCSNGLKYRAGVPKTIHGNHHIVAMLYREEGTVSAI